MPVIDFAPVVTALSGPIATVVTGIGLVAAVLISIPIAKKAWHTIMGFIGR